MNGYYSAPDDKLICCLPPPPPAPAAPLAIPYHFQVVAPLYNGGALPQAAGAQFAPLSFSIGSTTSSDSSSDSSSVMLLPPHQMMMIEGRTSPIDHQQMYGYRQPSPGVPPHYAYNFPPRPISHPPAAPSLPPSTDWMMWNSASVYPGIPAVAPVPVPAPVPLPPRFEGMTALVHAAHQLPPAGYISFPEFSAASYPNPPVSRKRKTPHVECTYTTSDYGKCPKKPAIGDIRTIRQSNRISDGMLRTKIQLEEIAVSDRGRELIGFLNSHAADRKEILLTALVYFELSARKKPIRRGTSSRSLSKRLMICLILAGKWLDDDHVDNAEWSRRSNVSLKCVNRLERAMFDNLGYDLSVSQQELLLVLEQVGASFGLLRQ
jgi:hypothetical protein